MAGFDRVSDLCSTDLLSFRDLLALSLVFPIVVVVGNLVANAMNLLLFEGTIDVPPTWPISIFWVNLGWEGTCLQVGYSAFQCPSPAIYLVAGLLTAATFLVATYYVAYREPGFLPVVIAGTSLVLLTNLLQGYQGGYVVPISGGSVQYYHDAVAVTDPFEFVSNFEGLQPALLDHSRTHPPGAVLAFYYLEKLLRRPGLISIGMAVVSTVLSAYYLWRLLKLEFSEETSRYVTYLFLLLPAVQIYYLASLDAVISTLIIGALYYFVRDAGRLSSVTMATVFVALCSFLTFTPVLFILPVFFAYEFASRRSVSDSATVLAAIALLYAVVYLLTGYNYVNSFFIASSLENPDGFRLLSGTAGYVFTRIEGLVEILVFFTPYLLFLVYGYLSSVSYREIFDDDVFLLAVLGVAILLGMFGAGVFRTGETARAANFIYPFLLLFVGKRLSNREPSKRFKFVLATVVFLQTVAMQIVGFYFW